MADVLEDKRVKILMLEDSKGAINGVHTMDFCKNISYLVDMRLAKMFLDMKVAVFDGSESVPKILYVNAAGRKGWSTE